jgi:CBS domain-containing protein
MLVKDLMTSSPITAAPTMPMFEARQLMQRHRIRHLLVVDGDELAGIVTDRDIRLNWPSQATSLSVWELNYLLARVTVGEIMNRAVIRVGPQRDARDAARLMLEHRIGALPITEDGKIIGIVTETDLLRALAEMAA